MAFFYSNFWEVKISSLLQARLSNLLLYYPLYRLAVFTDREWEITGKRAVGRSVGRSGGRVRDLRTYLPVAPLSSGVFVSRLPRVGWQADAVGLPASRTVDAAVVSRPRFRTNSFSPLPVRHSFSVSLSLFVFLSDSCPSFAAAKLVRFCLFVCFFAWWFFFPFFNLFLHVAFCFVCPFLRWLRLSCCCCCWFLVSRLGAAGTYVVTLRKRREENCACWSIMHVEEGEGRRIFPRSDWFMEDG